MKKIIYLLFAAVIVLFSCTKNDGIKNQQKEIVGKWQKSWSSSVYEFKDNGIMQVVVSYGILDGKYSFPEVNKIKMDITGASPQGVKFPSIQGEFSIQGDSLFVTYEESGYKQLLRLYVFFHRILMLNLY
jgi:hypothetical protein